MLPTINGKSFMDCTEADLRVLIDNPDYCENDYIDYKATFAFLETEKHDPRRAEHLAEFRSDVCQFANAEGGYLIYGIKDKKGLANEIVGVSIPNDNPDKFELERKNNLVPILPKMPPVRFRFIKLENQNYVVVVAVMRDSYAPYLHLENEKDFRAYKRVGNGKRPLSYMELKNMFIQSRSLERDVLDYRRERLNYFRENNESVGGKTLRFMLLHIIPETFTDSNYNKNVFQLERSGKAKFAPMFSAVGCSEKSVPNVDGLRYGHFRNVAECFVTNNGIVECFLPLEEDYIGPIAQSSQEYLAHVALWENIESVVGYYTEAIMPNIDASRVFICLTFVGCRGVITERRSLSHFGDSAIDRNELLCSPVTFFKNDSNEESMASFKVEYLLSIGIGHAQELTEFAKKTDS